jgi:hypothetical protein
MEFQNSFLKRSISSLTQTPSKFFIFLTCKQNFSSQYFDLDIENPLGGAAIAKLRSPL